mmetsp:Transcript_35708/g.94896  ORF Transcript_35708/g.94896 Transcript_35708/m.94896 type:complete len:675 (-) Transcript_35708:242-2266(-)
MNLSVPLTRVSALSSEGASSERDSCQDEAGHDVYALRNLKLAMPELMARMEDNVHNQALRSLLLSSPGSEPPKSDDHVSQSLRSLIPSPRPPEFGRAEESGRANALRVSKTTPRPEELQQTQSFRGLLAGAHPDTLLINGAQHRTMPPQHSRASSSEPDAASVATLGSSPQSTTLRDVEKLLERRLEDVRQTWEGAFASFLSKLEPIVDAHTVGATLSRSPSASGLDVSTSELQLRVRVQDIEGRIDAIDTKISGEFARHGSVMGDILARLGLTERKSLTESNVTQKTHDHIVQVQTSVDNVERKLIGDSNLTQKLQDHVQQLQLALDSVERKQVVESTLTRKLQDQIMQMQPAIKDRPANTSVFEANLELSMGLRELREDVESLRQQVDVHTAKLEVLTLSFVTPGAATARPDTEVAFEPPSLHARTSGSGISTPRQDGDTRMPPSVRGSQTSPLGSCHSCQSAPPVAYAGRRIPRVVGRHASPVLDSSSRSEGRETTRENLELLEPKGHSNREKANSVAELRSWLQNSRNSPKASSNLSRDHLQDVPTEASRDESVISNSTVLQLRRGLSQERQDLEVMLRRAMQTAVEGSSNPLPTAGRVANTPGRMLNSASSSNIGSGTSRVLLPVRSWAETSHNDDRGRGSSSAFAFQPPEKLRHNGRDTPSRSNSAVQ